MQPETDPIFRETALERLSSPEQLDQLLQVTTPKGWFALIALLALLALAAAVALLAEIPVQTTAAYCVLKRLPDGEAFSAVVYAPPGTQPIPEGASAQVLPFGLSSERGMILGQVVNVERLPVLRDDLLAVVGDPARVDRLLVSGDLVEARLDLERAGGAADQANGYRWSKSIPPDLFTLLDGMPCSAQIIVRQRHPIDFLLDGVS